MTRTIFLLGGTGFIGREVVGEAIGAGWSVKALARSDTAAAALRSAGAEPVRGLPDAPDEWAGELSGCSALIDLLQPKLPKRITASAVRKISEQRQAFTTGVLAALAATPAGERPVLFFVSGADDLEPDANGRIDHSSPLRADPVAFSLIGIPVRRLVEASGVDATYVYFGNMVYGPGKVFEDVFVKGLRRGMGLVIGSGENRLPLVHVTDAARALVHLAGLPHETIAGRTFLAIDGSGTTQGELVEHTAELMGVRRPRHIPAAIASAVSGRAGVETLTLDVEADPSALVATGFSFRYPSHREGVPATLEALGLAGPSAG
jgi:nucleoside-diphosphate-sugar epimerase